MPIPDTIHPLLKGRLTQAKTLQSLICDHLPQIYPRHTPSYTLTGFSIILAKHEDYFVATAVAELSLPRSLSCDVDDFDYNDNNDNNEGGGGREEEGGREESIFVDEFMEGYGAESIIEALEELWRQVLGMLEIVKRDSWAVGVRGGEVSLWQCEDGLVW